MAETRSDGYNGWDNWETWNVALWIGNDEGLYHHAKEFKDAATPYESFAASLRECDVMETPDGAAYNDSGLDLDALNELIKEL